MTERNIRHGLTFKPKSDVIDDTHLPNDRCLFCNGVEKNYKPGSEVEFICGTCVQLLFNANGEDLKRNYKKALDFGYLRKARAIKIMFKREHKDNEQRKPESKQRGRYSNRAGIIKSIGNQKERIKRVAV